MDFFNGQTVLLMPQAGFGQNRVAADRQRSVAADVLRWTRYGIYSTFAVTWSHMIPRSCLLIESKKFAVLPGEDQEITNERTYGKAFCQYLQAELPSAGVSVPAYCNEDWGWWLDVERGAFKMGLCIYSDPAAESDPEKYALMPSIHQAKKWSWTKLKKVDMSNDVSEIIDIVERVLKGDKDISTVTRHDDYPFE